MFTGPRLKVKRANEHIDQLNALLTSFFRSGNVYEVRVDYDAQKRKNICVAEVMKQLPESIPLSIGDAAHNLRSALDILSCEIVRAEGENPTKHTKFVFRSSRDELIAAINGGSLKCARAGIIALIVYVIQPYPGGDGEPLHALHDLDINDKHFNVLPIALVTAIKNISGFSPATGLAFFGLDVHLSRGKIQLISQADKIQLTGYGPVSFDVVFDDGQPFALKPVIPTLHKLSQLVAGAIDAIEKAYLPSNGATQ